MPTRETKSEEFESKTMKGLFAGYYVLPGGTWSGDYLVAEPDTPINDIDAAPFPQGKVRAHRTKEV